MFIKRRRASLFGVLVLAIIALVYYIWGGVSQTQPQKDYTNVRYDDLVVRFVDVGQGDCEIVQLPDGTNILIDGGPESARAELLKEIDSYGIKKFDYVVATHPHEDHIGGMDAVIDNFDIGCVYMPDVVTTTKTFENLLDSIENKNLEVETAKAGVFVINEENISMVFVAPNSDKYDDLNNYSAVLKFTYGKCSFLFTGDAEKLSENEMLEASADLSADVLKVGHHGSSTSSGKKFIKSVNPDYAIIEVGTDNEYGHPHEETIKALENIKVYRTDLHGDITAVCDGVNIKITTEDGE